MPNSIQRTVELTLDYMKSLQESNCNDGFARLIKDSISSELLIKNTDGTYTFNDVFDLIFKSINRQMSE